jgi:DNA-binding IclR family transcriptional regulator
MSPSPHVVLESVVEAAEATDSPVSVASLADQLDVPEPTLSEPLARLCACELLEATEAGYRPTVTAHELLAAGIELDDIVVFDVVEE